MSENSEIWNLSTLCRCCHADGHFKSLKSSNKEKDDDEIYEEMLLNSLGISILTPPLEASYNICDECIFELEAAAKFKKQVLLCEAKFKVYCKNEQFLVTYDNIKSEENDDFDTVDNDADDTQIDDSPSFVVKKEYSIEVDIKHPIEEEVLKENLSKTEKDNVVNDKNSIKTDKNPEGPKKNKGNRNRNTITKEESTKNGEETKKRRNFDRSLIIQVDTETGSQFSCKECGGIYPNKKDITQHLYKQHSTLFKCEYCPKQYKKLSCYKSHQTIHTGEGIKCQYCPRKFAYTYELKEHLYLHTRERVFRCDLCKKDFKYKQTLIRHLRVHAGTNKKILCDLCGRSFNDKSNLNAHVSSVHLKLRLFKCKICEKSFSNNRHLKDHLKIHSGEVPLFKCHICDHKLASQKLMQVHRLRHENKYLCRYCPKIFDDAALRREHVNSSHNKTHPWLPCSFCGKMFVGKYSLNRHVDHHHKGIKRFPCEHCDLKFSQKSVLKRHIFRKHNPEADINLGKTKCDICKHSFKNIILHMSTHSKRKTCEICGKTYADKSALNRHKLQKHVGRSFDCEVCGKKYLQRSKLNTHRMKVHNIKVEKVDEDGS